MCRLREGAVKGDVIPVIETPGRVRCREPDGFDICALPTLSKHHFFFYQGWAAHKHTIYIYIRKQRIGGGSG